ncbi:MAG: hypothetical protein A3B25_00520 [Candidatus Ryanbacteria bacterium RIFCSPLOWO2_01_FULL_48_26]|uniref:Uncharacterized protein n=1 Tax=Candidatus Ryanbacteria bacterium RIFCSPLOWO2_01_FULL_48_26 TaxID=1802126 RepID=A0A1G2GTN9_9BACT|nr:MAG: hypothetical protein A3B25_00520 [Candidatus Ryanbacteria bacterium RIFCSPLOWO2_01_FULL_48_26]
MTFQNKNNGQFLIEVLIAAAVGAVLITAAAGVIVPALRINTQTNRAQVGAALARELLENVRVWEEGDWHNISNMATSSANHYYLNTSSSPFSAFLGDEQISVSTTTYTRYFYVDDVYRSSGDLIVATGGSYDPSTKKVTVAYSWPQSATNTIFQYITRNRNNVFVQTDWVGGSGQDGPATSTNNKFSTSTANIDYASTTGSIFLGL